MRPADACLRPPTLPRLPTCPTPCPGAPTATALAWAVALLGAGGLAAMPSAWAQGFSATPSPTARSSVPAGSCPAPAVTGPDLLDCDCGTVYELQRRRASARSALAAPEPRGPLPLEIEADRFEGRSEDGFKARGAVQMAQGGLRLSADEVDYSLAGNRARARGQVRLTRRGDSFSGPELDLDTERFAGYVLAPRFELARSQGHGSAERADFIDRDHVVVSGARYSTCPAPADEAPAWELSATRLRLDFASNEGYAEGAVLRFHQVPILALPVMSFPVTDERKSGWLPPMLNYSTKTGLELGLPWYWNIAPAYDATLMPTYSAKRGNGLDTELRYLFEPAGGETRLVSLPHDSVSDRSRWALATRLSGGSTRGSSASGWGLDLDARRLSDEDYWRDGLRGADGPTPRLLSSAAQLEHRQLLRAGEGEIDQRVYLGVQRWQTQASSDAAASFAPPYQRAPQLGAAWGGELGRVELALQTEFNRFTASDASLPAGRRLHALGSLGWRLGEPGGGGAVITPRLSFNAARYEMDTPLADGRRLAGRTIPSFSIDSRWTFERRTRWFDTALVQTLEPRLFYLRTPWREQTGLPNFDSAALDLNASSMFEGNSFSGVDRVADAHQVTAGLTSRFVDAGNGGELGQVTVAQRFLLSEQRLTADGQPLTQRASDLYLLGATSAIRAWGLDGALQYNPDSRRIVRSTANMRFTPAPFYALSASYRLQRGSSEQLALGWQWPLAGARPLWPGRRSATADAVATDLDPSPAAQAVRAATEQATAQRYAAAGGCRGTLYGVGRLDYSLRDSRISGALAGFEYDAGCWTARLVAERQSTGSNAATTRIMLQLELVGLSRLGNNPLAVLKDNIPGYQLLHERRASPAEGPGDTPAAGLP